MRDWLTPQRLDKYPDVVVNLMADVETKIIADMAQRINAQDYFNTSTQWQYIKLREMGLLRADVEKRLSAATGKSLRQIKRLMKEVCVNSLQSDDNIYRSQGLDFPSFTESVAVHAAIDNALMKTNKTFKNITGTTANTAMRQFENALDDAWLQVSSGAFSHTEAVRNTIKDLAKKGLYVIHYKSGHQDQLDVAVRRAVLTGLNQTAAEGRLARAEELGCELVETTAHSGARPTHEVWQGKVFSIDGTNLDYPDFRKTTGYGTGPGLCGWNCRHSFHPFFEGMAPTYTEDDLNEYNAKKYTYNGEKLTEYEATQKQRYIERQIRRWKRELKAMDAAGLDTTESLSKLKKWYNTEKDFLSQTGLKKQIDRTRIEV